MDIFLKKFIKPINIIYKSILYMLFASFLSAFTGLFTKMITMEISSLEAVFFRNLIGLMVVSFAIYKHPTKSKGGKATLLFVRGFLGFVGILLFFYSIQTIPLGIAITLNKTSPIFGALFSFLFLKEYITKYQILAMLIAFFGVMFILFPGTFEFDINMFLAVLGGLVAGLAYTSIRSLKGFYDTKEILFSFSLIGCLFPFILLVISAFITIPKGFEFAFSDFIIPDFNLSLLILGLGLSGVLSQYFMTKAYENIKTGIAGTIGYTSIPFAIFLGVLLGDDIPNILTFLGIILIVFGGILINYRFKKKKIRR